MIVRIAGEGQFRMPSSVLDELNDIDDRIVAAVAHEDAEGFQRELSSMLGEVRAKGQPLRDDELMDSELVLPYADLTMDEAKHIFVGDGLISN